MFILKDKELLSRVSYRVMSQVLDRHETIKLTSEGVMRDVPLSKIVISEFGTVKTVSVISQLLGIVRSRFDYVYHMVFQGEHNALNGCVDVGTLKE